MDELIELVAQRTGLSEEKARRAVEVVIGFLKERLPEPLAGRIEDVLSGEGLMGEMGDLLEGLGGILGQG